MTQRTLAAVILLITICSFAEASAPRMPQGGGMIYPAWTASYYDNARLEGTPRHKKSEVRVRFDWDTWRPVLGVTGQSVRNFPTDGFSVRFTGKLIARFEESYTFRLVSDEGARLKIRPEKQAKWKVLIDAWKPHKRRANTASMTLDPAQVYDVEIEYYDLTGEAVCELYWSSPSTPEEVIDYVTGSSTRDYRPEMWADMNAQGPGNRDVPSNSAQAGNFKVDENGWPMEDFSYALQHGYTSYEGCYLLSFRGQAEVHVSGAVFEVAGKKYEGTLPKGVGYDAQTNRTQAMMDVRGKDLRFMIAMKNTQRTADSPNGSGVTELHVMKPRKVGTERPHDLGDVVTDETKEAFLPFMLFRVQTTGLNDIVEWKDRTVPAYARVHGKIHKNDHAYETLVIAANEMGRDLHLCFGGSINQEFMDNLAKLTRYGSDGVNPYDKPTPNPAYLPLNSNLRLYLEHGNEMGWSAIQPRRWSRDYEEIRKQKTGPVWDVLNFDGLAEKDSHRGLMRYHAYRTVQMSQAMRKVWGDAAMGETVRVFLFGQYERHFQNTLCQFINDYYNNGTGRYVDDPHPVSYYLWGSGPAVYYGSVNLWAETPGRTWTRNPGFEEFDLKPGTAVLKPDDKNWSFEGGAGVVDVRYPRTVAAEITQKGALEKTQEEIAAGFEFVVGDSDIYVYEVGRHKLPENAGSHQVALYHADGKKLEGLAAQTVDLKKADGIVWGPLRYNAWATPFSARGGLYRLQAGQRYIVVSSESKGDTFLGSETKLQAAAGITITGGVLVKTARLDGKKDIDGKIEKVSGAGTGFGCPTLRFTSQILHPQPDMSVIPPDPTVDPWIKKPHPKVTIPLSAQEGTRMVFLAGKGVLRQTVDITEPGEYVLVVTGAHGHLADNPLDMFIGEHKVWSRELLRGGRKPKYGVYNYGTHYIKLEPGRYEVKIASLSDDPKAVVYIDSVQLGTIDAYYGGAEARNALGAGAATGQTEGQFQTMTRTAAGMAQTWGLVPCTYEGGTNAGGDWNGGNVFYPFDAKWHHPYSKIADNNAARQWHKVGGFNYSYYYPAFPDNDLINADQYMPWQAARDRAMGWELEPSIGLDIADELTCQDPHFQGQPGSDWNGYYHPYTKNGSNKNPTLKQYQWKSWIVLVPQAKTYTLALRATDGGKARLALDDAAIIARGDSGKLLSGNVFLTRGIHSVKVLCEEGSFDVKSVLFTAEK
jgi:hypothetical protein